MKVSRRKEGAWCCWTPTEKAQQGLDKCWQLGLSPRRNTREILTTIHSDRGIRNNSSVPVGIPTILLMLGTVALSPVVAGKRLCKVLRQLRILPGATVRALIMTIVSLAIMLKSFAVPVSHNFTFISCQTSAYITYTRYSSRDIYHHCCQAGFDVEA